MLWLAINTLLLATIFFLISPANNLVITIFICFTGLEAGLLLFQLKLKKAFWTRFCLIYLPTVITALMYFSWQEIFSFFMLLYLAVILVLLELFLRQFSI
jgi:hypothetical protein